MSEGIARPTTPGEQPTLHAVTLRDYFAAKALPYCLELCRYDTYVNAEENDIVNAAAHAYTIADAMLAARGK